MSAVVTTVTEYLASAPVMLVSEPDRLFPALAVGHTRGGFLLATRSSGTARHTIHLAHSVMMTGA